jgi:Transposase, Mutator family
MGGKALFAGVRHAAGKAAVVQRCQVHKIRNVIEHLTEEHRGHVRQKFYSANAMREYADARRGLDLLWRELMGLLESQRGTKPGRRHGGDASRSSLACPAHAAHQPVQYQSD